MNTAPTFEHLLRVIDEIHPGAVLREMVPLKGGNSAAVNRVTVALPSGEEKRYVVRAPTDHRDPDHENAAWREFTLIQTMHSAGLPVQRPVHLVPKFEANAFYLLEYCEGAPELKPANIDDYPEQYAVQLARLHRLDF